MLDNEVVSEDELYLKHYLVLDDFAIPSWISLLLDD